MKKGIFLAFLITIITVLVSCKQASDTDSIIDEKVTSELNVVSVELSGNSTTELVYPEDAPCITIFNQKLDFNNDDLENEQLFINASAGVNDNNELMWDDINRWQVVMDYSGKTEIIFDGVLSGGKVYYWIVDDEYGKCEVLIQIVSSNFIQLSKLTFNTELDSITKTIYLDEENMHLKGYSDYERY